MNNEEKQTKSELEELKELRLQILEPNSEEVVKPIISEEDRAFAEKLWKKEQEQSLPSPENYMNNAKQKKLVNKPNVNKPNFYGFAEGFLFTLVMGFAAGTIFTTAYIFLTLANR